MMQKVGVAVDIKHPITFPTRGCPASVHPKSDLLGFSAALAPKFHPDRRGQEGTGRDMFQLQRAAVAARKGAVAVLEGGSGHAEGVCGSFRG